MRVHSSVGFGKRKRRRGGRGSDERFRFPLLRILLVAGLVWFGWTHVPRGWLSADPGPAAGGETLRAQSEARAVASDAASVPGKAAKPGAGKSAGPEARAVPPSRPAAPAVRSAAADPCENLFRLDRVSAGRGRTRLQYHFLADGAVWSCIGDTARVPAAVRPFVVEGILASQEVRQPLDMRFVLAPNGEAEAWTWTSGPEMRQYRLSGDRWIDSLGCVRGTPCPWRRFPEQKGNLLPGARWRLDAPKGKPVYSYIRGQVVARSQRDGSWSVTVHRPPEVYAEWSGLRQVRNGIAVGSLVEAGSPLGATGDGGAVLRVWTQGRPADPLKLWKESWPETETEGTHVPG